MLTPETVLQGRYRIVRQLGQGGMGAVYEAIDQRLDTTVALKETLFAEERLRKQFEREARLLARLHHPALPRVSDHFSESDGQFLVMQYIPGDDLSEMMNRKRGPFPANQVLTWAHQLLDALDYLHTQDPQIVHRDIKPQNLKLTSRGQIILLDFGLAKGQAGEISRVTTAASIFGYTPNYAPLEQIQGLGTDSRSDLYSLAATVYHLMTGVKPPDALTRAAALVNGQPDPLLRASEANSEVSPDIDEVLAKAMAQNREQRYTTAVDMRRALHEAEQASTVVNRGEAQTVLLPAPPPKTVPVQTQTVASPQTVGPTGETTVVRPKGSGPGRLVPIAILAGVLVLVGCVLGFFALKKHNEPAMQITSESPTPVGGPAAGTPSPSPKANASAEVDTQQTTATPKKTERAARNEEPARNEPKQAPTPEKRAEPRADADARGHDEEPPDTPVPPDFQRANRPRRPMVRVMPGGGKIQTLPDGTQIITTPDGGKFMIGPDGKRTVLNPVRPRRRPAQAPTPEP
jgi:eukaryotic-like serine/threonine-protein kinase